MGQGLLACRNNSCKRNGQGILSIATHRNSEEMGWVDQLRLVLDGRALVTRQVRFARRLELLCQQGRSGFGSSGRARVLNQPPMASQR